MWPYFFILTLLFSSPSFAFIEGLDSQEKLVRLLELCEKKIFQKASLTKVLEGTSIEADSSYWVSKELERADLAFDKLVVNRFGDSFRCVGNIFLWNSEYGEGAMGSMDCYGLYHGISQKFDLRDLIEELEAD